jgi:carbamoyltransferase
MERLLETYIGFAPRGFPSFRIALPTWLREKVAMRGEIGKALPGMRKGRLVFAEHHESHAASAFFPSPFEEAAILTLDGVGEWATATRGVGRGNRIELTHQVDFPHSLGLLYSAFTHYCGFRVNSGEYKLMGLAPYGEPRMAGTIRRELIAIRDDGSFRLNMQYFDFAHGLRMTSRRFDELFGGPARRPDEPITDKHADLAASIQVVTEDVVLAAARALARETRTKYLCMAGGVALNCVANGRVLREGPFENVWVQPAAGDAGGALGVALFVQHQLLGKERVVDPSDSQQGSLLGPRHSDDEIEAMLRRVGAKYVRHESDDALIVAVAEAIASEKVVGWFQGRMEFGPRALGARSILGDPRSERMQSVMNLKIKFRESFRPFAPSVLRSRVHEWFEMREGEDSPYMMFVAPVRQEKRLSPPASAASLSGLDRLKVPRSVVPAVTHVDCSARVQTVDEKRHGRYHRLLSAFEQRTGCPVLINTSFNVRGEPIVCTPEDAWRCFRATDIDVLVLERFVMEKTDQPPLTEVEAERWRSSFAPD